MRKTMIFLLILFSVPTLTLNETSCFCFNKRKEDSSLIDISNEKFSNLKLEEVLTGDLLYKEVRTQIGGWISPSLSATEIEEDKSLSLRILDLDNNIINDSTGIEAKSYTAKIIVSHGDIYFKSQNETYSIDVNSSRNKIDITTKEFNDVSLDDLTTGDSLYSEVRTQIGSWAEPTIDEDDIEQDQYTTIKIEDSSGIVINNDDTYEISGITYKVLIKVDSNDQYFQTQSETEYSIDVISDRTKVDISTKLFKDISHDNATTVTLLYNEVYKQIGSWAEPEVGGSIIEADTNITIKILNSSGNDIDDIGSTISTGEYSVKITINQDEYFMDQVMTIYPVNVIDVFTLVDISEKDFDSLTYNNINSGGDVYSEVRTQMAGWANDPNVTANDIKNDNKITLIIDLLTDNNGTENLYLNQYVAKITIISGDLYFVSQNETNYIINIS